MIIKQHGFHVYNMTGIYLVNVLHSTLFIIVLQFYHEVDTRLVALSLSCSTGWRTVNVYK